MIVLNTIPITLVCFENETIQMYLFCPTPPSLVDDKALFSPIEFESANMIFHIVSYPVGFRGASPVISAASRAARTYSGVWGRFLPA